MDDDELTSQIQAQVDEWSCNSTDSVNIDLVRPADGAITAEFSPSFTYPIFGNEEAIFGYQNLNINISFAEHSLHPHVRIKYDKIFAAQGEVKPTDIREALKDFLPATAFSEENWQEALRDAQAADFRPPGERVHQYEVHGQLCEIWCTSLADERARELLRNMEVLVPLMIEGGTMLQLEQDWTTQRWKLFLLYHVEQVQDAASYQLLGYGTSYRVWSMPDRQGTEKNGRDISSRSEPPSEPPLESFLHSSEGAATETKAPEVANADMIKTPLDLPSRERLSQFLIFPAFQRLGHGHHLYDTMYNTLTAPLNVLELTVEDPNEAFDDLRDYCDLLHLRRHHPTFAALRVNTSVPADALKANEPIPTAMIVDGATRAQLLARTKLMPRQFDRLVEMHTLSFIPPLHRSRSRITKKENQSNEFDRAYYFWRLYVKQRLYVFNRDQLIQLEREERVEKLEQALDSVLEAYASLLERVEKAEKKIVAAAADAGNGVETGAEADTEGEEQVGRILAARSRKRKVVEEDDDDGDGDEDVVANGASEHVAINGTKKARVAT